VTRSTLPLALALACLTAPALTAPALADTPPPAGSLPLSQVIALIESREDVHWIDEVEWDDDGYWEIEYHSRDGRRRKVRIDPLTGAVRG